MSDAANALIRTLDLAPHPEGGWYRETWRSESIPGADGAATSASSILFLLTRGQRSRWHRVPGAEIWIHQGGGALVLRSVDAGRLARARLGPDAGAGDSLQAVVPPGAWQDAACVSEFSLVACVVVPAFRFETFELAPEGFSPPLAGRGAD